MRRVEISGWITNPAEIAVSEGNAPVCNRNEVCVAVKAAAITFSLWLLIQGKYQRKPQLPFCPGSFIAGQITKIGQDVRHFKVGDCVIATAEKGGLAEEAVVNEGNVYSMPARIPFVDAVGLGSAYSTALAALTWPRILNVKPQDTLLVHGASGALGAAAIEIGRALGANVIATARSPEKREWARSIGAHHAIDPSVETLREHIYRLTEAKGVDAVFDPVGGALFNESLRCMRANGRIVPIGFASGDIPRIEVNYLLLKNLSVCGLSMGHYRRTERERYDDLLREDYAKLADWHQAGLINPKKTKVFPLTQISEAFTLLISGERSGSVVVLPDEQCGQSDGER